jgi:Domain of unknown function (DUF5666)
MENKTRFATLGVVASIVGVLATAQPTQAQTREARGTVTSVTDSSLSMKAGAEELTVFVDSDTHLSVRRTERDIQKEQPGRPSPRVNSFFEPGQAVLVRYRVEKGRNMATDISRIGSAGEGSISNPAKISAGKVKLVTASQLVIDDGGRELSFGISGDTNVLAKGATKATKAAGGSTPITTFVHAGDTVSVSYHEAGAKMMASEVRVTVASR